MAITGSCFQIAAGAAYHHYLGLDANDIPVLAGNRPGFMIPGHEDHTNVTIQNGTGDKTVVKFGIPTVGFADAGTYRWYIFGNKTLQRLYLVVAGEYFSVSIIKVLTRGDLS